MSEPFTTTYRVYAEDVDYMGIVYHANHLRYFERARTESLRELGLSLTQLAIEGTYFAIHDVNLIYHAPARLDDLLTIKTECSRNRAVALQFNQSIINQCNDIICEAKIQVVCLNAQFKPKRLPDIIPNIL